MSELPELPEPQDATEAALLSECWDAVLSYADLCTSGSSAATTQLATEAFTHGMREAREALHRADGGPGLGSLRLPHIPSFLTSVRITAASWETHGKGDRLDPDLRLWLNSDKAARYTGPLPHRPLALRGLSDMQEPYPALLWLAEVEALPLPAVARRLGLDPASAARELGQARTLFRERCLRNHIDTSTDAVCSSYARLLDAVTRSSGPAIPEDLSQHLATCVECAEAAACLRLHSGGLAVALVGCVIGWGGLAYLERRRRAAEAGLSTGRADVSGTGRGPSPGRKPKPRVGRTGLLVGACIVSVLTLAVSLMPFDSEGGGFAQSATRRQPATDPDVSLPAAAPRPPGTSGLPRPDVPPDRPGDPSGDPSGDLSGDPSGDPSESPRPEATRTKAGDSDRDPQGEEPSPVGVSDQPVEPIGSADSPCRVVYEIVKEWSGGFKGYITVTSTKALDGWSIGWTFQDGQRISELWGASYSQDGSRVTASAVDRHVAAGDTFDIAFLASQDGDNTVPGAFTLNGQSCTT